MDGIQVGRLVRAVRIHKGFTQSEVGGMAGISQSAVARVEHGDLRAVTLATIEHVASALGISLRLEARWHGGDGARLVDREHAAVVELVVAELRRLGWEVLVEYTFNHFGERGSVDVVGWHASSRSLVIVEVKSRITDLQDLLAALGRKIRIVPDRLAEERSWESVRVGRFIALPGSTANRGMVERHRAIFDTSFPARAVELRRWLVDPGGGGGRAGQGGRGSSGLAAVWFVSSTRVLTTTGRRRVRKAQTEAKQAASPSSESHAD